MMSKKLIILFTIFFSTNLLADCHVSFYKFTYYLTNSKLTTENLFKSSTCSTKTKKKVLNIVQDMNQWGYANHLKNVLKEQNINVRISPKMFFIGRLESFILKKLSLDQTHKILINNLQTLPRIVTVDSSSTINVEAKALSNGKTQVHLQIAKKHYWNSVDILVYKSVPTASRSIMPYSALNHVVWKNQWVSSSREFITKENIPYYQSNKAIRAGNPIVLQDIFPRTLVKAGMPTKITLVNGLIKLQVVAIPYSNGKYGDLITFRNIKTGKKISAKVTNENEAMIQL
jgi:flagella basal body P-ring formation protein FlgA